MMKSPIGAFLGLLASGSVAQRAPYFVLGGGGMPLAIERADPIMSPGIVPSKHTHSIVGGNGFAAEMDFAQAQKSTCSTVSPKADKSNYWMPNVYFHDPKNGSVIRVPEEPYHKIYYKYGNGDKKYDTDIKEFPKEFRMVAGNVFAREFDRESMGPYGSSMGWTCHGDGTSAHPNFYTKGIPTGFTSCLHGFAAHITFPSCWNGEDFNISAPSAHMAYPLADTLLGCPTTHRAGRFPQIFIEYWLNVKTFDGLYTAEDSPFVLSSGDSSGFGFHADFLNGWDEGVLNAIMPTCNPGNTGDPHLSDDSCFGKFGGIYTDKEMKLCTQAPLVEENVGWNYGEIDNPTGHPLTYGGIVGDALPGNNPIESRSVSTIGRESRIS